MKFTLIALLAFCLGLAVGCSKNLKEFEETKAFAEIKAKAEAGDAYTQFNLGLMYYKGEGVLKDNKEAVKWWRKAAEQGDAGAQNNLGGMYAEGEGVQEDNKEAVKWWRKAADQGQVIAQYNLGVMYAKGEGVLQDYVTAYVWVNIAEANDFDVKKFEGLLEKKMTSEQIAKSEELFIEMVKKNPKLLNK